MFFYTLLLLALSSVCIDAGFRKGRLSPIRMRRGWRRKGVINRPSTDQRWASKEDNRAKWTTEGDESTTWAPKWTPEWTEAPEIATEEPSATWAPKWTPKWTETPEITTEEPSSTWGPKWTPKWTETPEIATKEPSATWGPKWTPKWTETPDIATEEPSATRGPKWTPKWTETPEIGTEEPSATWGPKWTEAPEIATQAPLPDYEETMKIVFNKFWIDYGGNVAPWNPLFKILMAFAKSNDKQTKEIRQGLMRFLRSGLYGLPAKGTVRRIVQLEKMLIEINRQGRLPWKVITEAVFRLLAGLSMNAPVDITLIGPEGKTVATTEATTEATTGATTEATTEATKEDTTEGYKPMGYGRRSKTEEVTTEEVTSEEVTTDDYKIWQYGNGDKGEEGNFYNYYD